MTKKKHKKEAIFGLGSGLPRPNFLLVALVIESGRIRNQYVAMVYLRESVPVGESESQGVRESKSQKIRVSGGLQSYFGAP